MEKRDNLSVVQYGINDLRLMQTALPNNPGPNEVQLWTHTVGICGSDIHILVTGKGSGNTVTADSPMICGHESSAVVAEIGRNVKHLKVGDRVAVEPGEPCFKCEFCTEGSYNLCPDMVFHASPPYDGCLRRYYNHCAVFCHKIPDNMTFGEGALIEPLAVAVYGCQRTNITEDSHQKVLVIGAGPIGLLCALAAKASGAVDVCILDINENRLKFAKQLGIEKTLLISVDQNEYSIAAQVIQVLGQSPNVTLECTGVGLCIDVAIEVTRKGGKVALIGLNTNKVNISLSKTSMRETILIGVQRYRNCFPLAINMVSNGKIDVKPLITNIFEMKDSIKAFETSKVCEEGVIKVQIVCQ